MNAPLLFDSPAPPPTTRTIALTVKRGGPAALDQARRRADDARYQEITCRSALNAVKGMPFNWTLNPYRGCTHGCHYCFARKYQTHLEMGADDEFASVIFVKVNFVEVLRKELAHPKWSRELAALGTATDPYQPIEGHYKISRGTLAALVEGKTPVGIVTKGPMVVRDVDVLQDLSKAAGATVCISVPTVDDFAWRTLEPGTAPPLQRLRALRTLVDGGIKAGIGMAPLLPGLSDKPELMADVVRAARDAGATHLWANMLYLRPGTREHFMEHLARDWPELLPLYERLYQGRAYLPEALVKPARTRARDLAREFDLRDRRTIPLVPPAGVPPAAPSPAEQLSLIVATDVEARAA
jgi:DNA repair photolyase